MADLSLLLYRGGRWSNWEGYVATGGDMQWTAIGFMLLVGCGGGGDSTATGTVGGHSFKLGAVWWGGPHIVFTEAEYECLDMAWVETWYNDENPPGDEDKIFLQISWTGDDVATGFFDVTGESAVNGDFWINVGGALTVHPARTGQVIIDEVSNKDEVTGTFDFTFDDGAMTGELDKVEWCTNIK